MELYQIRHFIAVAGAGGFSKGAQWVAVSQPAISASIAKLEAEFNVKLLERRHSRVVLTAAGMRLLEVGKTILQTCNSLKAEMETIANRKLLRIGILQLLSTGRVSKLLTSFQRANPNIPLEVIDGRCDGSCPSDQLCGSPLEGELDAALTIFNGNESRFANRALFKMPYMLAVREDHRFAERQAVNLCELANEPFIVPARCVYLQDVMNVLACRGIEIHVVYRTDRDDMALTLVAAGLGLALVPGHFQIPAVKQVPVSGLGISRTVGLVWQRERESSALEEFIAFAASHCWEQEPPEPFNATAGTVGPTRCPEFARQSPSAPRCQSEEQESAPRSWPVKVSATTARRQRSGSKVTPSGTVAASAQCCE
jgi:DNA-binding transcriptional LysR family regulator